MPVYPWIIKYKLDGVVMTDTIYGPTEESAKWWFLKELNRVCEIEIIAVELRK